MRPELALNAFLHTESVNDIACERLRVIGVLFCYNSHAITSTAIYIDSIQSMSNVVYVACIHFETRGYVSVTLVLLDLNT